MRYQPSEYCIECKTEKSVPKKRFCRPCLNKRHRERAAARREKLKAEVKEIISRREQVLSGKRIKKFFKECYDPRNIITREVLTISYARKRA